MWLSVSVIHQILIFSEDCRQSFVKDMNYIVEMMQQCLTETTKMMIEDWTTN